ncbi:3756_t:CDS:2, partial [Racocetra fulgida]
MKSSQLFFIIFGLLAFTSINSPVLANNYGLDVKCEKVDADQWVAEFTWNPNEAVAQQDDQMEQQKNTPVKRDRKYNKDDKGKYNNDKDDKGKYNNDKDDKN